MAARARRFALTSQLRLLIASALALSACNWTNDRELTSCFPNCHPDSGIGEPDATVEDDAAVDSGERDAEPMDAVPMDATPDAGPLESLQGMEVTAHQITWRWDPETVPSSIVSYRLTYALIPDAPEPQLVVWDTTDDANLGFRTSPFGPGVVDRTRVLGLAANTRYYANLEGVPTGGGDPFPIAQGSATTLPEPNRRVSWFDEEIPPEVVLNGFNDPSTAAQAYQGANALWFQAPTSMATTSNMITTVSAELAGKWPTAYLELFVLVAPARDVAFLEVELTGAGGDPNTRFSYFALASSGGWYQLEVPLRAFRATPPTATGGFGISAGGWGDGATMFVDAVAVRYTYP